MFSEAGPYYLRSTVGPLIFGNSRTSARYCTAALKNFWVYDSGIVQGPATKSQFASYDPYLHVVRANFQRVQLLCHCGLRTLVLMGF